MSSEDKSWVFDSLVGFLKGPLWNGPINSFVEQKSIFFEAEESTTEEHAKIHNEYKNLVDYMLGTYMEEMGITPAEFENACSEPTGEIEAKLHQTLFEQIWAANDMSIFKQMMAEKNLDLQLQALEMIHNRFGVTPQSYVLNFSPKKERPERVLEKQVLGLTLEHDTDPSENSTRLRSKNENGSAAMNVAPRESGIARTSGEGKSRKVPHIPTTASKSKSKGSEDAGDPSESRLAEERLQKRKEYLQAQRDKLMEMRKREKEKTAKGTRASGSEEIPHSTTEITDSDVTGNSDINPKTLQIRKALAKRLKEEVIKKPLDDITYALIEIMLALLLSPSANCEF
ncbi:cilia- and flagella-associated protein 36 isoform X2 [Ischnura elegans]|uniref:cilia- and flagella-associated protein 36 isoform X2 n=1 Tax=Ischnura elegans TaxID=197161 RepID=UPI001ED8878E|nr:cilia- and flagella-associated protein 36 isoform X2 [Ischnura elegans]